MKQSDASAHLVPTWSAHSTPRSLIVAVVLAISPFLAVVTLSYPTLAVAFLTGALVAAAAAAVPRFSRRARRNQPRLTARQSP